MSLSYFKDGILTFLILFFLQTLNLFDMLEGMTQKTEGPCWPIVEMHMERVHFGPIILHVKQQKKNIRI